jgi:hypothetical protein
MELLTIGPFHELEINTSAGGLTVKNPAVPGATTALPAGTSVNTVVRVNTPAPSYLPNIVRKLFV